MGDSLHDDGVYFLWKLVVFNEFVNKSGDVISFPDDEGWVISAEPNVDVHCCKHSLAHYIC